MQATVREGVEAGRACEVENGYWKLSREHWSPCGVHPWPWPSSVLASSLGMSTGGRLLEGCYLPVRYRVLPG